MELIIDKELQSLIPPQQPAEYQQLEENILRDGCLEPIDVWNQKIIDGHNRYKICKANGIPYEIREWNFMDKDEVKIWIIRKQFGRRNLNDVQRVELALVLEPIIAAKAKKRQGERTDLNIRPNFDECSRGRTDEELARLSGVSRTSVRRVKNILEKGTPEQIQRARAGGKGNSINAINTEIKHMDITEKTCPMCGKTLPIDRFYGDSATCKTCTEIRKQEMLKKKEQISDTKSRQSDSEKEKCSLSQSISEPEMIPTCYPPDAERMTSEVLPVTPEATACEPESTTDNAPRKSLEKIVEELYDTGRVVIQTADDVLEDLGSVSKDFVRKVRRSLQIYSSVTLDDSGRKAIRDLMDSTIKEIECIKRMIS